MIKNIAIIGASGAIGSAFTRQLSELHKEATVHAFSRDYRTFSAQNIRSHLIDYEDETFLAECALLASQDLMLDRVIVATGLLHGEGLMPEKSLKDLSSEKFHRLFQANTILPALIAKHFLPKINKEHKAIFAVLSARVGSITDNRAGGWYAYRASKAALNMIIKNVAIEIDRRHKKAIIIGLHPGTVNSDLSKPFQGRVPNDKLFTPDFSVKKMIEVMDTLTPKNSGSCFDWDGKEIEY